MTDSFSIIPLDRLLGLILNQLKNGTYFGIPSERFFTQNDPRLFTTHFKQALHTPIGVAAGPHSQLAQNIVGAWLCGARFIELKTVQTLDELNVTKPCIDMQDEGYNCEWSQELKIHESFEQYLNAWIIIHILNFRFNKNNNVPIGTIFNMSVGYNLEGILNQNVQWFFEKMKDCKSEKDAKIKEIKHLVPEIEQITIPDRISNNITLSTMHGCPPDEIERIGQYLIATKNLHTVIKLNPTLLGKEKLTEILNNKLGFKTEVPDIAFEHDLKYADAIGILNRLRLLAQNEGVEFGIKLTNTLESLNNKDILPESEPHMYMSGRSLHPISIAVANKISNDIKESLSISFSAGIDYQNISKVLSCGLSPVTVCSDLLKPGGYARIHQYIEAIYQTLDEQKCENLSQFISQNHLSNLDAYSTAVCNDPYYQKAFKEPDIKVNRPLDYFDCIHAPCVSTCPSHQGIPDYMYYTAQGDFQKAYEVILQTNPLPIITGNVCDHECQSKCTRINYDNALAIREVKRFVAENQKHTPQKYNQDFTKGQVTVIGAGPSGLSCAYFMRLAGFDVTVLEQKTFAGGMVAEVIPSFRIGKAQTQLDLDRIMASGVKIQYGVTVDSQLFKTVYESGSYIYIATGATITRKLNLANEDAKGIMDPLDFLSKIKENPYQLTAKQIIIIGGGNTAMDVARTAKKYAQPDAKVTIAYRRRKQDMPAEPEEILAALAEGIDLIEMVSPTEILTKSGEVSGLKFIKMQASGSYQQKRLLTLPIEGSEFVREADLVFPAIGQEVAINFIDNTQLLTEKDTYATKLSRVFIGGDARKGASNIISAIADGRKAAKQIQQAAGLTLNQPIKFDYNIDVQDLLIKKAKRGTSPLMVANKKIDEQVPVINTQAEAMSEASRCLLCHKICNVCVSVCPNFANYSYQLPTRSIALQKAEKKGDEIVLSFDKHFEVKQDHQIAHLADFCNECGNCNTFCPSNSAPYKEKPHFFLSIKSFNNATNGYFISTLPSKTTIIQKNKERFTTLTLQKDEYIYETEEVLAKFHSNDFSLKTVEIRVPCVKTAFFENAATLMVLLEGMQHLYIHESKN